jgi:hypothetical protein
MLHIHGATQKFLKFYQLAQTCCHILYHCLVWLTVCFLNQCANSCQAEKMLLALWRQNFLLNFSTLCI